MINLYYIFINDEIVDIVDTLEQAISAIEFLNYQGICCYYTRVCSE